MLLSRFACGLPADRLGDRETVAHAVAGLVDVIVSYLMLFFAPGETARYGGIATHATPSR
jgi:hypothetical protein